MEYIDLTLQEGGGSGGTTNYNNLSNQPQINGVTLTGNKTTSDLGIIEGVTDYTDLSNLPQINGVTLTGNKTTADLGIQDARILSNDYTITVATDGTGDFTDIQSALDSLQGKVCAGAINVNLKASDTFNVDGTITIPDTINCGCLNFKGSTTARATINCAGIRFPNVFKMQHIAILDLNIVNNGASTEYAITLDKSSPTIQLNRLSFNSFNRIVNGVGWDVTCLDSITIANGSSNIGSNAFACWGGHLRILGCTLSISNFTTGIALNSGAWVQLIDSTYTISNVTNRYAITKNTFTASGTVYVANTTEN